MFNRNPQREASRDLSRGCGGGVAVPSLGSEGIAVVRHAYRWLNLTLMQQGIWPLLVVVFAAPSVPVALTPWPWYGARLAAPTLAAVLALAYLAQRPREVPGSAPLRGAGAFSERDRRMRQQVAILIIGVTTAVGLLRLVQGPFLPVLKLETFGLVDVVAYQVINFGVAGRLAPVGIGGALPVVLFALSWGLRDLFLAAASSLPESLIFSFAGGAALGAAFGALALVLRRWPGGSLSATAAQFLLFHLVFGFLE